MDKLPFLNLGCGNTWHPAWTNIDFVSGAPEVIAYNLLRGIPFPDNSFEVVYHSHVLEHLPRDKGQEFVSECYRVMKPGGVLRIAIPDLESIARNYLKYLEESLHGVPGSEQKYDWTMLEMYDQTVRSKPGGGMVEYIREVKGNDDFLLERNGQEAKQIMVSIRNTPTQNSDAPSGFSRLRRLPSAIKNRLLRLVTGEDHAAMQLGKFRLGGEIHQWMYDRYSLRRLLERAGFSNIHVQKGFDSSIPGWEKYNLDGENGLIRKPDSLFMEARK